MKLSAKIEYAYKAVLELSLRYDGERPVQLSLISEAQRIPKKFLIQLFLRLKNAHVVNSVRGISGGYYLARPPSQISFADVVRAVDDSTVVAPDLPKKGAQSDSERLIGRIWGEMNKEIAGKLSALTFDKLAAQLNTDQLTYNI